MRFPDFLRSCASVPPCSRRAGRAPARSSDRCAPASGADDPGARGGVLSFAALESMDDSRVARPVMLLVLGVHRSGTSVTARALECLGAAPSSHLHEALPNNPTGFFEDRDVERFNEYTLLPSIGARWHDLAPPDWRRLPSGLRGELFAAARAIIRRNFAGQRPLSVLKEPRICTLLPFWVEVLESLGYEVRAVGSVRDPLSVARSLSARDGFAVSHGAMLYATNWIQALAGARRIRSTLVSYDALLEDADTALRRVAADLDIACPGDFERRVATLQAQFLDPRLRHSAVPADEVEADHEVPRLAVAVHRLLEDFRATGNGAPLDTPATEALAASLRIATPVLRAHDLLRNLGGQSAVLPLASREEMEEFLLAADRMMTDAQRIAPVQVALQEAEARLDRERARADAQARDAAVALARETALREQSIAVIRASVSWRMSAPIRWAARAVRAMHGTRRRAIRELRDSGLLDPVAYVLANPEVRASGMDPVVHYLEIGGHRGLDPSHVFSSRHYLDSNPDVRATGINPLLHYERRGRLEGRVPMPPRAGDGTGMADESQEAREVLAIRESGLFDVRHYLEQYPDVRDDGMDPVVHYVRHGWREGRNPYPTFDTAYYRQHHALGDDDNPLIHYLREGFAARLHTSEEYRLEAARQRDRGDRAGVLDATRRTIEAVRAMVAQRGGPAMTARRAFRRMRAHGPVQVLRSAGRQLRGTIVAADRARGAADEGAGKGKADGAARIPASCRVLFVGCDGLVAGSQVLLLNTLRWMRSHTGIEAKIILIGGGDLVPEYARCGPVVVWNDLLASMPDRAQRRRELLRLFGDVDLVYGNTVIAAGIYDELSALGKPFLTHVHELEKSIRAYATPEALAAMVRHSTRLIACSPPVAQNLVDNHGIDAGRLRTVNAFIERRAADSRPRGALRRSLGLPERGFLVVGCGTVYWRKGVDLFIDAAARCRRLGLVDARFVWIGAQHWDADPQSRRLGSWRDIMQRVDQEGLSGSVEFMGPLPSAREHFAAADVFFLPSREDPFPLVALEAAQCGTPIVCFAGTGGMPDFVADDAGIVVPHLDVDAAAAAIAQLHQDRPMRERLGAGAAAKLGRLHVDDIAVPEIVEEIRNASGTGPLVSVVVPVYNQRPFVERRIESILAQGIRDLEIIVLDDCSTDGSAEALRKYEGVRGLRLVVSERNSGSPFRQWARGIGLARGTFVWIAEGDDACTPDFLAQLLPMLADPSVALAYCDSTVIDEADRPTGSYREYYESLDHSHWRMDHVMPAEAEVNLGLGAKNTIPNASAAVFRRDVVSDELLGRIGSMRFAGDWMFWVQLAKGRKIAFRSQALNMHRKHSSTVTHRFNNADDRKQALLDEVREVHDWVLANYPLHPSFRPRFAGYLRAQVEALFPGAAGTDAERRYPLADAMRRVDAGIAATRSMRPAVTFVTTNDFSHDGGSEQLWIHAAKRMAELGHRVQAVIRRWDPEPYFLADFRALGIQVTLKDERPAQAVAEFRPDLVVVNIGDQDEGTEWYAACRERGLPYVIVNHLTKEPRCWPIRHELMDSVRAGNLGARQVLFTSRNNRQLMERRLGCRIPHAGLFHNPLFVDRSRRIPFPPTDGALRLAMPARMLNVHKGLDVAVEVFSWRKWRERRIELHLYGNGPDEPSLRSAVAANGLRNVFFHDPRWQLPRPDMEAIWTECHALLMTSHMEGMPLVLLNAMFHGRVPVVTDIGGHREVVDDGICGFVADEATPASVDVALERAWERRHDWESIGRQARERMLRFSPEDPVADFIERLMLAAGTRHAP
ncbi:MAG: glycosyltransferase [Phycisphaerales bacterium]|nr:glycosyltransferase [Phycisphaerales bacterium]